VRRSVLRGLSASALCHETVVATQAQALEVTEEFVSSVDEVNDHFEFAGYECCSLYDCLTVISLRLTDKEKTDYLANLWLIARADKALSDQEKALIDEVQKTIQAKRVHNSGAQKAVESGGFSLTKVGSFANQVQNLEDMVAVAFADSDLAQAEVDLIASFCGMIGVQQEQLDLVTSDVSKRLKKHAPTVPCAKCGAQIQSGARFCPSCGAAVEGAPTPATALEFDVPKTGYAVTFSESTAPGFTAAIELAKQIGPVQTIVKNKRIWYLVSIASDRFPDVFRLAKALSGMRNRAIYKEGEEMDWDEVFGFIWCATRRDQAYNPVEYCFGKDENRINPWGCKQSQMGWSDWSNWFSYGRWQKTGIVNKRNVWVFDKDRIRHDLSTNLHRYRFCPYLSQDWIEAFISAFPQQVEVVEGGPWKYNSAYEESSGCVKVVEKEGEGEFSYTREYFADGVRPRGLAPLQEILIRAFAQCADKPQIAVATLMTK
jgi:uncharacterized tellurite resistance protein B-like protein